MKNGWTGGQYSLYRVIFGAYLFVHCAMLIPWGGELFSNRGVLPDSGVSPLVRLFPNVLAVADSPAVVIALLIAGAAASLFFAAGYGDRVAAVVLWYVLAVLFGRNPLIANPSLPFVGWLLLAHAFVPAAPYGSVAARGRVDPRGGWSMPPAIFAAAWIVMSAGYSYSGYTKLVSPSWVDGSALARVIDNPLARPTVIRDFAAAMPQTLTQAATLGALLLELLYVPLALFRRVRPWIWTAMLLLHLSLMVLIDFADLSFGMVILHLFTFDPAWVRPRWQERRDWIFYDGTCGLCHRATRFVLAEDRSGSAFRFAPLNGDTFYARVPIEVRAGLPDSVVVLTEKDDLYSRSDAAIYVLERLGGYWRIIARLLRLIPRRLRDGGYDFAARIRYRLFKRPSEACPMLPADLRGRFSA